MTRYELSFRGRVQGVGFRAATCDVAKSYDVSGWVRNEPDGSVSLVIEGDREHLEGFLAAHRDRLGHFVSEERLVERPAKQSYHGFEIR